MATTIISEGGDAHPARAEKGTSSTRAGSKSSGPAMRRSTAVADATSTSDVVAQFNALLASLRASGIIST